MTKTNVMRLLDAAKIPYRAEEYAVDENDLNGMHAAEGIGMPPEQIFKTLVAKGERGGYAVFCIPVCCELDLKKAAKAAHDKKIELIHVKDLLATTGYIRGGCSPIGMKKHFPTFIDETAIQCGFCTPGMVMAAKALLDKESDPSEDEIRRALRGNICRCTGYVKIVDAVRLAARLLRDGTIPESNESWAVGSRVPRLDVREKVLGYGEYTDDMYIDGMAYASALRAEYPRARILKIYTQRARAADGIIAVFTAKDIPGQNKVGHLKKDWDTMIAEDDCTRYLGDAVAWW